MIIKLLKNIIHSMIMMLVIALIFGCIMCIGFGIILGHFFVALGGFIVLSVITGTITTLSDRGIIDW